MRTQLSELAKEIYAKLGSGYSERVYHNAFEVLLRRERIPYETERIVPILFEGHTIGNLRADLIVDGSIVVELKAVKSLGPTQVQQCQNYLKLLNLNQGLLINFPQPSMECCEINFVDY